MTVLTIDDTVLIHESRNNLHGQSVSLLDYCKNGLRHNWFADRGWTFSDPIDYRSISPFDSSYAETNDIVNKLRKEVQEYLTNYGATGTKPIILMKENRISMKSPDGSGREFLPDGKTFVIFLKKYGDEYILADYDHIKSLNQMDRRATSVGEEDGDEEPSYPDEKTSVMVPRAYLNKVKTEHEHIGGSYSLMEHRISFINALGEKHKTYIFNQPIHLNRMPLQPRRVLIDEKYVCEYVCSVVTNIEEIIFYFRDHETDIIHPIGIVPYNDVEEYLPRKLFH